MKVVYGGVYFLFDDDELVYIGQSDNIMMRIGQHIKDKKKKFNRFEFYETSDRVKLESWLIAMLKPKYNKTCGDAYPFMKDFDCEIFPNKDIYATISAFESKRPYVDFRTLVKNAEERTGLLCKWTSPYYLARDGKINAINIDGVWKVPLEDAENAIEAIIKDEEERYTRLYKERESNVHAN